MKAYANEFKKKKILKNKKLKREKKYMATNKFSERERKMAGPAEWWSKKCNCLRPQVKKRPPNFNQSGYL